MFLKRFYRKYGAFRALVDSRDAGCRSPDLMPVILLFLRHLAPCPRRDHEPLNCGLTTSISLSISRTSCTTQTSRWLAQAQNRPSTNQSYSKLEYPEVSNADNKLIMSRGLVATPYRCTRGVRLNFRHSRPTLGGGE